MLHKYTESDYIWNLDDIIQMHRIWFRGNYGRNRRTSTYHDELSFIGSHGAIEIMRRCLEGMISREMSNLATTLMLKALKADDLNKTRFTRYLQRSRFSSSLLCSQLCQQALRAKYNNSVKEVVWNAYRQILTYAYRQLGLGLANRIPLWVFDAGYPNRRLMFQKSWRTSTAVSLAETIREDESFDRMPILADALEESGMTHEGLLKHLRTTPPEHFTRASYVLVRLTHSERYFRTTSLRSKSNRTRSNIRS
jgi:hypothetical protein